VVNAHHVKQVPGRKTDASDADWLCQLLECGLLRGGFVPPEPIRELRDLTRRRKSLTQERQREANRLHKVLEDSGVKLSSVASDVLGVSGRRMLEALCAGHSDPAALADLARGGCGRSCWRSRRPSPRASERTAPSWWPPRATSTDWWRLPLCQLDSHRSIPTAGLG